MSERIVAILRLICIAGLAGLLVAAHPHHRPSASQAPSSPATQPVPSQQTEMPAPSPTTTEDVAALVNDAVISNYDVNQRIALFISTSGVRPNKEEMKQIRDGVLRSLVDETLELQEAAKNKVTVTNDEVNKALETIAHQNNVKLDEIKAMLKRVGVDILALQKQVVAQLSWNKLVESQLAGRVEISDKDVDAEMARLAESARKPQFLVSEIFIAIDTPGQEDKARNNASQIVSQLNLGEPFAAAAGQFSQSASAAGGGDIGWVEQGQLNEELNKALASMHPGQIVGPIRALGGFYILQLRDRREPAGTVVPKAAPTSSEAPDGPIPLMRLLLPLQPKTSDQIKQNVLQIALQIRQRINGCANLPAIQKSLRGSVLLNLGTMPLRNLSPDVRNALSKTQPGDVAPPFFSADGIEIIVRCDPKVENIQAIVMPTHKEVESRLFNEQISMMARRYLRDLRRDAVVEYR